ncbi:MAG: pyridoxine 5'-phosphate synthase [Spirochaetes bacterium GWB1_36_13]|nr:MAG: pyridoxine 5'-phosphate synthase [Spirochaetes bacterium GWB1_36_13]
MKLSVNIDHIATLRQARRGIEPDPLEGAFEVLKAGADGITFHLREDRRHIQDKDVYLLKEKIKMPLNFEAALSPEIVDIILEIAPEETTLVPEKREEVTTEGGLDVIASEKRLLNAIPRMKAKNILVSLFVDPDETQIRASKNYGADAIEIHTGHYAALSDPLEIEKEWNHIKDMVLFARDLGLIVNAGHGLNYENTQKIALIKEINELNIGHSIISRSIFTGLHQAVKDMLKIVKG